MPIPPFDESTVAILDVVLHLLGALFGIGSGD